MPNPPTFCTRIATLAVTAALLLSVAALAATPARQTVTLGFEQPGVVVTFGNDTGDSAEAVGARQLVVSVGPKEAYAITDLSKLQGLVDIESASQALRFVRLRTSVTMVIHWDAAVCLEIVSHKQLADPAFRDVVTYTSKLPIPAALTHDTTAGESGSLGELSSAAYAAGRFAPPKVERTASGWTITRWIFCDNKLLTVQKWRETVGRDGSYSRKTVFSETAPNLPGTHWSSVPGLV